MELKRVTEFINSIPSVRRVPHINDSGTFQLERITHSELALSHYEKLLEDSNSR